MEPRSNPIAPTPTSLELMLAAAGIDFEVVSDLAADRCKACDTTHGSLSRAA